MYSGSRVNFSSKNLWMYCGPSIVNSHLSQLTICTGGGHLSSDDNEVDDESLAKELEFDVSELGDIMDDDNTTDIDETEPIQSLSLTSTTLSRYNH